MANQQVKIDLLFQANTTAAQNNIQQLSNLLHQISTKTVIGVDGSSLSQAVQAAQQLQTYLQNAVNVNTGKLDLMQLRTDLKASGTDLQTLTNQLRAVGPIGEQAFLKVASAVSQAEVPMIKANGMVKNFMTTLANTAKWQIASSAIHGVVGAFNSATSHAKNLNKALTDIQIVTGYSTDYMSRFAESASKAAKELNTTTTEYAKAALIFYQQGLSGEAVAERAETVVKLAQVTGQTAQTVSDQMTAIWNNFHTGSQELEYYADVLTKLGAATAASTDEISDGLQKFAAVAKTVDLSYETAAAAVATVVDKTRQSADVVGTSFKTIFARMEGLSLGDTLEDGVDLNKYSEALEKVGVDVLNARGELRSMDAILDDLGSKWQGLGEETQVALAQTVGGVRQYNQMMSLMNNWEDVKDNIELAKDATGELAVQQEIWSKSYEGSLERLTQAKNELYEQFISDDMLKGLNNTLTKLIEGFSLFIEKMGGLGPFVGMLTLMFSRTLFPLLTNGFTRLGNMISVWSGKAARDVANMQGVISSELQQMVNDGSITNGMRQQLILSDQLLRAKQELMLNSKNMSAAQRAEAESRLAVAESLMAETTELLKQQSVLEKQAKTAKTNLLGDVSTKKQLATDRALAEFRNNALAEPLQEGETEEARAQRINNISNGALSSTTAEIGKEKAATIKQNAAATSRIGELGSQRSAALQAESDALQRQQAADAELARLESFTLREVQGSAQKSGSIPSKLIYTDDKGREFNADEIEKRKASLRQSSEQAGQDAVTARGKADSASAEMTSLEGTIKTNDAKIAQLEKELELKRKINEVTRDTSALESTGVGTVSLEGAGMEDGKSARLHAEDQSLNQTQFDSENQQMASVSTSLGGTFNQETGAMEVEASIANYEKLYQAIGETAIVHSKLEGAVQDVGVAMKGLSKETSAVEKTAKKLSKEDQKRVRELVASGKSLKGLTSDEKAYAKALKNQEKVQKASVKTLKNSRSEYIALAKQAKLSDDGIKELEQAFNQLDGTVDEQKAGLATIESTFKTLGIATDNVGVDLQLMADKMEAALLQAGFSEPEVKKLTNSLKEMAQQAPMTAGSVKQTENAFNTITTKGASAAATLGQFSMTAMSVVGNVMSLTMGVDSMKKAFDESLEPEERQQQLLSGLMGILPMVSMLFSGLSKALNSQTMANFKAMVSEYGLIGAIKVKTGTLWANTAANIANLFSNPFTMALAIIAMAAIAATVIAIIALTKKTNDNTAANYKLSESQQEANKTTMDLAEKTVKLADAWLEQMGVMDELIAKYNKLNEAKKQAAGSTEEILEAVPDLIDAYDDLAENVLKVGSTEEKKYQELRQQLEDATAKGNVEEIENITYEIDKLLSKPTSKATKTGVTAGTANVLSSFYDAGLNDVHGIDKTNSDATNPNIFVEDLETDSKIYGSLMHAGLTATRKSDGYVGLALRADNEGFVQDYEAMKKVYEDAIKNPALATDEGVQLIKTILDASKDSYDQLKELYDAEKVQKAAEESLALGDLNDIGGYKEYAEHRSQLINNLADDMGWEDAEKYADQFLSENGATKDFETMRKKWEALANAGSDITQDMIAGLSEEDQKLFLELDINKYQTETAVETALDIAQAEADAKEITATMNIVTSMKDTLKDDGMTSEDWGTIRDSGFQWGEEGNIEFAEFINMSYKEQQKYLEQINLQQQKNLILAKEQAKVETEAGLRALQTEILSGTLSEDRKQQKIEEYNALVEDHKKITDELLIQKEVLENMEIAAAGLNADEVKTYAEHLQEVAKNSEEVSIHLQGNEKVATMVAKSTMRMNRGVEALNEGIMEWDDILKNSDKSSQEYSQALGELRTAMADVLDVDEEFLSSEFLSNPENLELMKQAAEGSAEAIDKLAQAASRDILLNVEMPEDIKTQVMQLHDELVQNIPDLKVGASIDESGFQQLIDSAKMSVEEAQAYFNALGYEPTFETIPTEVETEVPLMTYTRENLDYDEKGNLVSWNETVHQTGKATKTETHDVPVLSADGSGTPKIKQLTKTSSGSMNNFSAKNAGGSKAKVEKAKEIDKTKKTDIVERYKEVTDALDDVEDAMNKASKAADRLYGPARLKEMEKSNKLIKDKIKLLEKQKKEAQANLAIDTKALGDAASKAGVKLELDESGNITNYTAEMTRLYNELAKREAIANSYAGGSEKKQSEYIENNIEPLKQIIENLKSSMEQYEETRELLEDLDSQLDEEFYAWQDNNYDQLNYKLESQVEINDSDLEEIDYYLGKMEDDFYKMAESAALLIDSSSALGKSKLGVYTDNYSIDSEHFNSLQEAFNKGEISQAAFVEGMKEVSNNALADAQALQELDDTMLEYYGNTLAMAGEELAKYTERMEHQTAILEHYKSIMDIIGESTDYEAMGIILEGQAKTIENELTVAKENYALLADEADYWKKMMESVDETDPAFEVYKANWEDAEAAAREAQDTMLSKTEEWAEAMKAVLENKLAGLAQTLENALTGGTSFDTITTQMERAASLQEEYLTTTNKIYHTNKMINTAQQAIDKTTNTVAKQKLKSFQQETAQLQAKKKLSQYELDIQQAKYDLLLAEIALEEAQQSKSMVRLQRDSEGNFGYIYTADQNQLADAQQKVLDAENALYNKGLEGANDYTQKYQQTMQEMYDTLGEIQEKYLNGEFETEEAYHKAMDEAKAYYYQKLQDYSSLYQVAITTDSRVVADAWSTDFADMTYRTEDWKDAVDDYVVDVNLAFEEWESIINRIREETVGEDLDELAEKTGAITSASDALTESVVKDGGLLDALKEEIIQVGNVTSKYATQRDMVMSLITQYELLAVAARNAWQAQVKPNTINSSGGVTSSGSRTSVGNTRNTSTVGTTTSTTPSSEPGSYYSGVERGAKSDGNAYIEPAYSPASGEPSVSLNTSTPIEESDNGVEIVYYSDAKEAWVRGGRREKKTTFKKSERVSDIVISTMGNGIAKFKAREKTFYVTPDSAKKIARYFGLTPSYTSTITMQLNKEVSGLDSTSTEWMYDDGSYATITSTSDSTAKGTKFYAKDYIPAIPGSRSAYYVGTLQGRGDIWYKMLADDVEVAFNTGGYTGSWGTEGKIAMLHEKELVLNADDTTNFLASLEVLREIVNTINLHSMNAQLGGLLSSPYWIDSNRPQTLEQQVHIEANFPNVSDRNEIEEAFNNLVSKASQYVNRK